MQLDTTAIATKDRGRIGTATIARFDFKTSKDEQIVVVTALSGVSAEGAHKNLVAEAKDLDFEGYRNRAAEVWNKELAKIEVKGGTSDDRVNFYTALYHSMIAPTIYSDVDGAYFGPDGQTHAG